MFTGYLKLRFFFLNMIFKSVQPDYIYVSARFVARLTSPGHEPRTVAPLHLSPIPHHLSPNHLPPILELLRGPHPPAAQSSGHAFRVRCTRQRRTPTDARVCMCIFVSPLTGWVVNQFHWPKAPPGSGAAFRGLA